MGKFIAFLFFCLMFYLILRFIRRSVFFKIYKTVNTQQKEYENQRNNNSASKKEFKKNIKWDAETVDYEEIED